MARHVLSRPRAVFYQTCTVGSLIILIMGGGGIADRAHCSRSRAIRASAKRYCSTALLRSCGSQKIARTCSYSCATRPPTPRSTALRRCCAAWFTCSFKNSRYLSRTYATNFYGEGYVFSRWPYLYSVEKSVYGRRFVRSNLIDLEIGDNNEAFRCKELISDNVDLLEWALLWYSYYTA